MSKLRLPVMAISIFFMQSRSLLAQVSPQDSTERLPVHWNLQDCLDYALKNNITINTLRLDKRSAGEDLALARANAQPNLTATGSEALTLEKRVNASGGYGSRHLIESGSYQIGSTVTLYQGGYVRNNVREKQYLLQGANLNILQEENDVTLNVTQAFLNILLAKENIIYLQDLVQTSKAQVQQAQQKYDAGSIALKDLAQLQAQNASDKYSLITAENTHRQNIISLKILLQLPSSVSFEVQEPDTLIAKAAVTDLKQTQDTALANRPEVKIADNNLEVAKVDLQLARAGYMPVLTGSGGIGASHSGGDPGILQQLDNSFYQTIGLGLSIPIFQRRITKTAVEKAKIEIEQTQLDRKNTRNNLALTVEQAYTNVVNAQAQYDAAVEQLQYNKETYRIASEQLKIGAVSTVDFLVQKNLYTQAFQEYVQAKYNAALTIRIYDFYRGVPIKL